MLLYSIFLNDVVGHCDLCAAVVLGYLISSARLPLIAAPASHIVGCCCIYDKSLARARSPLIRTCFLLLCLHIFSFPLSVSVRCAIAVAFSRFCYPSHIRRVSPWLCVIVMYFGSLEGIDLFISLAWNRLLMRQIFVCLMYWDLRSGEPKVGR